MPGRSGSSGNYLSLLAKKKDRLDWTTFNLLENMLVFCLVQELSAPPESGVAFRISRQAKDGLICLLFKIDRTQDPLITDRASPRPDYLTLYISQGKCICTIVEMKGKDEKELAHGIEQIKFFRDMLKREFQEHLRAASKVVFQGILLSPYNADIPRKQITKEAAAGFVILPLQYHQKAELFPYISKVNTTADLAGRYEHKELQRTSQFGYLEGILSQQALHTRIKDSLYAATFPRKNQAGIYINYILSDGNEYAVLKADDTQGVIFIKEEGSVYFDRIKSGLEQIGLKQAFRVQKLDIQTSE